MKNKYPSELTSKVIRISLDDYATLEEIRKQKQASIQKILNMDLPFTMAEALHMILKERKPE